MQVGADGLAHVLSDVLIDPALARDMASRRMFVTSTLSIIAGFHAEGLGAALADDPRISPGSPRRSAGGS